MSRASRIVFVLALGMFAVDFAPALRAQDPPPQSLGDAARKIREEKAKNSDSTKPKPVITNDDLGSGGAFGSIDVGTLPKSVGTKGSGSGSGSTSAADPTASFDRADAVVKALDNMDRGALIRKALEGTPDWDFPGRANWETRLVDARHTYVTRASALLQQLRSTWTSFKKLNDAEPGLEESDPRVQNYLTRLRTLSQQCVQVNAAFHAVMLEGRDLAKQPRN